MELDGANASSGHETVQAVGPEHHHVFAHQHTCTRFCQMGHEFGNVYRCCSTGKLHVCDSNCAERVQVDNYTAVCRLSRKVFQVTPLERVVRKRSNKEIEGLGAAEDCQPTRAPSLRCLYGNVPA
ncbi:unnamed protein product [Pedinophyceae sp. YPF-701]|nr:unnamed protein product [Pedinophyceae sp. YPF-701]